MTRLPSFLRCTAAALAGSPISLCVPLLLAVMGLLSEPLRLPDGSPDDGYTHVMLMMLMAWPVLCLALALFNTILLCAMIRFKLYKKIFFITINALLACTAFYTMGSDAKGIITMAVSFGVGAMTSWWIANTKILSQNQQ